MLGEMILEQKLKEIEKMLESLYEENHRLNERVKYLEIERGGKVDLGGC